MRLATNPILKFTRTNNTLTITSEPADAAIYYTMDGKQPTMNSMKYTAPITPTKNCTIKAIAMKDGVQDSEVSTYEVDWFKAEKPTFSLNENILTITSETEGASIYYTVGAESVPSATKGILYTAPVELKGNCTVKAIAIKNGYEDSEIATYEIDWLNVEKPVFSLNENTLTITSDTKGASIYYTVDGKTTPSATKGTLYTAPIELKGNCVVKAIAVKNGYEDSEVVTYEVDWFKVEKPTFSLNENVLTITSETEGASIYYTLGAESVPSATRGTLYTAPVELKGNNVVKAIAVKDGYKDSEIATYNVDELNVEKPVFSLNENTLTITSDTKGASIYYTVDGKTTPSATKGTLYTAPIELKGNCVVKAIAVKNGYEDSEVVTYEVDWFKVEKPTFSQNGNTLTITSETEDASIYYTLGAESVPSATNGTLYTAPIELQDNRMVRAIAVKNGYDDSDIAEFVHGTVTCPTPAFEKYDGRYFTITPISGAEIHYTTDGTTPTKASPLYDGRTAVTGLCTIKAIALSDVKNPSNVSSFAVTYFYSGEQALLTEAGTLEKAFEWCGTQDMEELSVNGPLNAADLTYIKEKLSTLQFLNLEDATIADHQLPTEAFADMQLVSFTSPKDINSVGDRIFANCQHLAAIVWNASEKIPANSLGDNQNPNLLVYVSNKLLAPAGIRNVVANGTASTIVLADAESNNNFYCPIAFIADKISYTHNYSMKTEVGQCMGWETIALPFTVQKVTHESKGELTPYKQFEAEGSSEAARPFWLRALTSTGFEDVAEIEANTPYIISMPNSSAYAARYNVAGNVTFSAEKAEIPATKMNAIEKGNVTFMPTFTSKAADRDIWLINKNMVYEGEQEGSVFVPNMREARPFEAYMTSQTIAHAPRFLSIAEIGGSTTGIVDIMLNDTFDADGSWYTLEGRKLQGKPTAKGVYIVNGKKVIIK
ncbi:MAG: chitobiase/beta-hexosaminidase C-terminal domain-containing protein [Prevotella sp.]|nr:chitobiase/beta-hexosaminidase C-terminal domain-containing protein [Prevotella sp.]